MEKANEYQLKLCVGYIDYEKAFDSVEQSDLFTALRKISVSEGYVHIIEDIYTPGGYFHRNAIRGCAAQMGRFLTKNP